MTSSAVFSMMGYLLGVWKSKPAKTVLFSTTCTQLINAYACLMLLNVS